MGFYSSPSLLSHRTLLTNYQLDALDFSYQLEVPDFNYQLEVLDFIYHLQDSRFHKEFLQVWVFSTDKEEQLFTKNMNLMKLV